ncbi:hypothetical protein J3Q64DRAFT_1779040 [Phycomyces blakesleeanus]|uniref:Leucine-rich repeat-containing protein n=2 Tax=Phycomyces blakesleeanus TaxID=4837 RepID=A0A163A176_PHYB8|nr:hypothetical protein PHYBLDRAFT_60280 [Phycomyces blakesleeanus NRRL 1555(-)]OAD70381.1 hypothetical protein PHYBLDRAFT_60280 [Phycomyces blakesleeanus NRRL 1555(-)]|eukprot:XP_018288421.1 hypothetical protein PHYBLDRAFT_60280 [Phycomyces blakesleeanus NRRL 1555(-)]
MVNRAIWIRQLTQLLQDEAYFHPSSPLPLHLNLSELLFLQAEHQLALAAKEKETEAATEKPKRWSLWGLKSKSQGDTSELFDKLSKLPCLSVDRTGPTIDGFDAEEKTERVSLASFGNLSRLVLLQIHPRCMDVPPVTLKHLVVQHGQLDDVPDAVVWSPDTIHLTSLSLANNTLARLQSLELLQSLTHLDVSHNLLDRIPEALSCLFNLQYLNLAHNKISSVAAIHTTVGNIQELNLRGNSIRIIDSLDRLWAIERLDLRENCIESLDEFKLLAPLPNLETLWVQSNPCTEQTEYRIELFRIFEMAGSRVILDNAKLTHQERLWMSPQRRASDTAQIIKEKKPVNAWPRPRSIAACDEGHTQHSCPPLITRSKSLKTKRMIRLGEPVMPAASSVHSLKDDTHVLRVATLEQAVQETQLSRKSPHKKRSKSSLTRSIRSGSVDSQSPPPLPNTDTEAFRRKIETIRSEAGTEWLRVLQEMDLDKK